MMFRIIAPHFVAGGDISKYGGQCVFTAPIIKYMVGWKKEKIVEYCHKKKWKVEFFEGYIAHKND